MSIEPETPKRFIYTISFLAGIGGFLFGYDTGAISGALLFLKEDLTLTLFQQEVVVSVLLLFAAISAPFAGILSDHFGRKQIILISASLFVIAALVMGLAPNFQTLVLGRALVGAAIGTASFTVPLYVSELSPPSIRGISISVNQLMVTIGILAAYGVDYTFAYPSGWRWMLGLAAIPGSILFLAMLFLPQTPRWLLSQGRKEEALEVFNLMGSSNSEVGSALEKICQTTDSNESTFAKLFDPNIRKAVIIGIILATLQQITGINTVIYYAPTILSTAGEETTITAIASTVGIGLTNVLTTIVALLLIDKVGRRPLLIAGTSFMAISLATLSIANALPNFSDALEWFYNLTLFSYITGFAIGLGPIVWVFISEAYPQEIRGTAMSVAAFANWASNFFVALTYLTLLNSIGASWTFGIYAMISGATVWFACRTIPETKGRSLEEIQTFWQPKAGAR